MRISDWSSDVCSSDLSIWHGGERIAQEDGRRMTSIGIFGSAGRMGRTIADLLAAEGVALAGGTDAGDDPLPLARAADALVDFSRSEERRVGKECGSTCKSRWAPAH